eukprot:TRINITY_DN2242_c1_g1_i1.p2 TRINITY_DN2242_c1_g1~~TRINITY_DN2242_c1_g1_i1.p2  ORF type:complete len:733 (-),score=124.68 TRINITY_DN2242_c1_g1_i1:643-2841(-)
MSINTAAGDEGDLLLPQGNPHISAFKRRRRRITSKARDVWSELNTEDWWSVYTGFPCAAAAFIVAAFVSSKHLQKTQAPHRWDSNPLDFFSTYSVSIPIMFCVIGTSVIVLQRALKRRFSLPGFCLVFLITFASFWLAANRSMAEAGVGTAVWAIAIGMFFSNVVFRVVTLVRHCCSATGSHIRGRRRRGRREHSSRRSYDQTLKTQGGEATSSVFVVPHADSDHQMESGAGVSVSVSGSSGSKGEGLLLAQDKLAIEHESMSFSSSSSSSSDDEAQGYTESETDDRPIRGDNEYYCDTTDVETENEHEDVTAENGEEDAAVPVLHDEDFEVLTGVGRYPSNSNAVVGDALQMLGSSPAPSLHSINNNNTTTTLPPHSRVRSLSSSGKRSRSSSVKINIVPAPDPIPPTVHKTGLLPEATKGSPWTRECVPPWLSCVSLDEFFIKVSLVVLIADLASSPGVIGRAMISGWIDTPIVLVITILVGKYVFRLGDDHTYPLAASLSVCGASAANAVGSAIGAGKEAVGYAIAVMALFTVPLIPIQPLVFNKALASALGLTDDTGGAWIGGSIDTTGAVVASADIISSEAKDTAATVKMLQNCIIGPICLVMALTTAGPPSKAASEASSGIGRKIVRKLRILWDRFPRFVLGFFCVSLFFSFAVPEGEWQDGMKALCGVASAWFETMGFAAIGINIRITEMLKSVKAIRLIPLYIFGQTLDLVLTMVMAWVAFQSF